MFTHVYPHHDLKEHDTGSLECECRPEIDYENELVIHNSYDGREAVEWAEDILENSINGN